MPWRPSLQCSPVHAAVTAAADADGVSACCASSLLFDVLSLCVTCGAEEAVLAAVGEAVFKIGKNACMKNQWIAFDKASKLYVRKVLCLSGIITVWRADFCLTPSRDVRPLVGRRGGVLLWRCRPVYEVEGDGHFLASPSTPGCGPCGRTGEHAAHCARVWWRWRR